MPVDRDKPAAVAHANSGPLPLGRYFIIDRQSGGRFGWLYDVYLKNIYGTDRQEWFALYRNDGKVDDETFVNGVRRGAFRLHPIGPHGRSEGCITLANPSGFKKLADYLRGQGATVLLPGTTLKAYGFVEVR